MKQSLDKILAQSITFGQAPVTLYNVILSVLGKILKKIYATKTVDYCYDTTLLLIYATYKHHVAQWQLKRLQMPFKTGSLLY